MQNISVDFCCPKKTTSRLPRSLNGLGSDFPDEFTHSKYTKAIRGANEKAKANVITAIGELIQISDKKAEFPDYGNRHGN